MSFFDDETSLDSANPIELYLFSYNNLEYTYTSHAYSITKYIDDSYKTFNPEFIKRSDSLRLGDSGGSSETCTITVARTNEVALLYKGAPPELDAVRVNIYRVHGQNNNDFIRILRGCVSQVNFTDSYAELVITIESVLCRDVPRGKLSYYCQNCIYDSKCGLKESDYALECYVDGGIDGLTIYSTNLNAKAEGYFNDGYIRMGTSIRSVVEHKADWVRIKYPLALSDKSAGKFTIYPGCNSIFEVCARKFQNTDNFSGVPYIQPYDAFNHPVSADHAYWVNGNIVDRDTNGRLLS